MQWCQRHWHQKWAKVLSTDEIYVDLEDCKNRVWHPKGKRPMVQKSKFSKKIMLWGGISSRSRTPIIALTQTMNSDGYINMLQTEVVPWINENMQSGCVFQQDNATVHTSKKTQKFLEDSNLQTLEWPANSPDLSPIENVWAILKRAIEQRCPRSIEELLGIATEEWAKIPQKVICKTIKTMKTHISQVIARKGNKCDY
jgi:transposase